VRLNAHLRSQVRTSQRQASKYGGPVDLAGGPDLICDDCHHEQEVEPKGP
jgi:hypothetical protein